MPLMTMPKRTGSRKRDAEVCPAREVARRVPLAALPPGSIERPCQTLTRERRDCPAPAATEPPSIRIGGKATNGTQTDHPSSGTRRQALFADRG